MLEVKKDNFDFILRFAPSPTGEPHVGNIRTALINWIVANSTNSKMLLRVEDTDKERSKDIHFQQMIQILNWLKIDWSDEIFVQSKRILRHQEVANYLIDLGKAYKCYCSIGEENCNCRNESCLSNEYAVKLYVDKDGFIELNDKIKGKVIQKNENLNDIVILRRDKSPTYMFCVVVDDHDMGINLVIRGDDHLTNTFKQIHIYRALGWEYPEFGHLPMLLSQDGSKLSKRNSVVSIQSYIDEGILPNALKNYLIMLSWKYEKSQKENKLEISEIFDISTVLKYFKIEDIKKAPSKFDWQKLLDINKRYIQLMSNKELISELENFSGSKLSAGVIHNIINELAKRSKTLKDLWSFSIPYIYNLSDIKSSSCEDFLKLNIDEVIHCGDNFFKYVENLKGCISWNENEIENITKKFCEDNQLKLVDIAQPLRLSITGSKISPNIFHILELIGKDETIGRIYYVLNESNLYKNFTINSNCK